MAKLNKAVLVWLLCISSHTVFGQSKEETISWLKEKLELSLIGSYSYVKDIAIGSINECAFTIRYTYALNNSVEYHQYTIPVKDLAIEEDRFYFDSQAIKDEALQSKTGNPTGEKEYRSFTVSIKVKNREADLHNRIVKAFKHLATFCPQKKEAF